jgi:hypothetical protein
VTLGQHIENYGVQHHIHLTTRAALFHVDGVRCLAPLTIYGNYIYFDARALNIGSDHSQAEF